VNRRPATGGRRVDLHTHTIFSDGLLTPEELVARAVAKGLVALAITDHDKRHIAARRNLLNDRCHRLVNIGGDLALGRDQRGKIRLEPRMTSTEGYCH